jgi:hypothetical protein
MHPASASRIKLNQGNQPQYKKAPIVTLFALPTTRVLPHNQNGFLNKYRKVITTVSCGYGVFAMPCERIKQLENKLGIEGKTIETRDPRAGFSPENGAQGGSVWRMISIYLPMTKARMANDLPGAMPFLSIPPGGVETLSGQSFQIRQNPQSHGRDSGHGVW